MATTQEDGERIVLGRNDIQILNALLYGQMKGYEIVSQCQLDTGGSRMSTGAFYPAIRGLVAMHAVAKTGDEYKITRIGQQLLTWELERLERQVKLIRQRLPE
jgi:DNA-binding PadR family transcriptional regulator